MKRNEYVIESLTWLIRMASVDGIVSEREKGILKEFAENYNIDYLTVVAMAEEIAENTEKEVDVININESNGRSFEEAIVSLLKDEQIFTLLQWRGDKYVNGIYSKENLLPDLHIEHKFEDKTIDYFIECKWRKYWYNDCIDLGNRMMRYRIFSQKMKREVFIALGVGGTASCPDELYIIPLRMMYYWKTTIFHKNIAKYKCEQTPEAFHKYIEHFLKKM